MSLGATHSAQRLGAVLIRIDPPLHRRWIGSRARARGGETLRHVALYVPLHLRPFRLGKNGWDEIRSEARQRIALSIGGDLGFGSISALIIGSRVTAQPRHGEPDERRASALSYVSNAFAEQC